MIAPTLPTLVFALSMPVTQVTLMANLHGGVSTPNAMHRPIIRNPTEVDGVWAETQPENGEPCLVRFVHSESRFTAIYANFAEYTHLPVGWDGAYGQPASDVAVNAAADFLEALPAELPEPTAMISPDGEVALYWSEDDYYAEAGFSREGYSYFFSRGAGRTPFHLDGHLPGDVDIRAELVGALQETYALAA